MGFWWGTWEASILSVIFYFLSWVEKVHVCLLYYNLSTFIHLKSITKRTITKELQLYTFFKKYYVLAVKQYNLNSSLLFLSLLKYFPQSNRIYWIKWIHHIYLIQYNAVLSQLISNTTTDVFRWCHKHFWKISLKKILLGHCLLQNLSIPIVSKPYQPILYPWVVWWSALSIHSP